MPSGPEQVVPRFRARTRRWPGVVAAAIVFATVVTVMIRNERRHVIDLSKEEAPFNAMRLPLKSITTCQIFDPLPGGTKFENIQLYLIDSQERTYHFEFNLDEATGTYEDPLHRGPPLKDRARAREICLYLLKNNRSDAPPEYYTLSGETPKARSYFSRMIRSIFR